MQTGMGHGMYAPHLAAHLVGLPISVLRTWAKPTKGLGPVVAPTYDWGAYSFVDLISLGVAGKAQAVGVQNHDLRRAVGYLANKHSTAHPFAHVEGLRELGGRIVTAQGEDASRSGQMVLAMFEPDMQPIEFGPDDLAVRMRPVELVLLDPEIQVGHPCVENTRVTTEVLVDRFDQGEPISLIAEDLELTTAEVEAGVAMEHRLQRGTGIQDLQKAA